MTQESDLLDRSLVAAFDAARNDDRWSGEPWRDPIHRLHGAARGARIRAAAMVAVAAIVVVGGSVLAVDTLRPGTDRLTVTPAGPGTASGLDWLLTADQYRAYTAAHPSPSPAADLGPSPVPIDSDTYRLKDEVMAALGQADTLRVDAADGGQPGHAVLWLRVDGTPVAVERYRLGYPLLAGSQAADNESFTPPQTWPDGTAFTIATGDAFGYAFGPGDQWSGPVVWTVTPDGLLTSWTAPVSADRLLAWARAADAHSTGR